MSGGGDERDAVRGWLSRRVAAGAILVFSLLVFTWPFVRTPRLSLGNSYLHLMGAWLGVVVLLHAMARAIAGSGDDGPDDAAGADGEDRDDA